MRKINEKKSKFPLPSFILFKEENKVFVLTDAVETHNQLCMANTICSAQIDAAVAASIPVVFTPFFFSFCCQQLKRKRENVECLPLMH
jgi:hypothetical protein